MPCLMVTLTRLMNRRRADHHLSSSLSALQLHLEASSLSGFVSCHSNVERASDLHRYRLTSTARVLWFLGVTWSAEYVPSIVSRAAIFTLGHLLHCGLDCMYVAGICQRAAKHRRYHQPGAPNCTTHMLWALTHRFNPCPRSESVKQAPGFRL